MKCCCLWLGRTSGQVCQDLSGQEKGLHTWRARLHLFESPYHCCSNKSPRQLARNIWIRTHSRRSTSIGLEITTLERLKHLVSASFPTRCPSSTSTATIQISTTGPQLSERCRVWGGVSGYSMVWGGVTGYSMMMRKYKSATACNDNYSYLSLRVTTNQPPVSHISTLIIAVLHIFTLIFAVVDTTPRSLQAASPPRAVPPRSLNTSRPRVCQARHPCNAAVLAREVMAICNLFFLAILNTYWARN